MRPYRYRPSVMAAVDVESLTITYGKVTAVDDVSFQARAGEVTCILGPNGAGKTSTIEALEGLRRPASGRLSVVGLDPQTEHFVLTERMGVMLQEGGIHPGVTVRAALRHAAALYDDPLDVRGLVDQLGRQVIRQVISDLRNEGVTVLLTTHDLDEAERVADRVIIIDRGRLLAEGTVAELTRTPDGESRVSFRAPAGLDRLALAAHLGADVTESAPGDYTVAAPPTPAVIAAITAWLAQHDLPLGDLRAGRQRLEDVYLRLTSREGGGGRPRRGTGHSRRSRWGGHAAATPEAVVKALLAQLRLELGLVARNGESLLLTLGIPVGVLVFFSLVDVLPIDGEAVDFLAPGTLSMAIMATAFTNLAIATGVDRSYGGLKWLGVTPLGRPRLLAAKALTVLVVIVVQAAVLVAVALALGWKPDVEPLPLAGAVLLAIAAFTGLALIVAGRLRALVALAAANALFVALMLLSGMLFPLDELPDGLRDAARSLPSTALAEAVHGALTAGVGVPGRVWPVLTVWAIAAVALAIALFRWEPSD